MNLKRKVVRDLFWSFCSPNLVISSLNGLPLFDDHISHTLVNENGNWLRGLDMDPTHLIEYLKGCDSIGLLGYYFENLVKYWLIYCPSLKTKAIVHRYESNNGIIKFVVVTNHSSLPPILHIEIAIKFFVDSGSRSHGLNIFGPFLHESFATRVLDSMRKLKSLNDNNLQQELMNLLVREESIGNTTIESRFLVRGRLYIPIEQLDPQRIKTDSQVFISSQIKDLNQMDIDKHLISPNPCIGVWAYYTELRLLLTKALTLFLHSSFFSSSISRSNALTSSLSASLHSSPFPFAESTSPPLNSITPMGHPFPTLSSSSSFEHFAASMLEKGALEEIRDKLQYIHGIEMRYAIISKKQWLSHTHLVRPTTRLSPSASSSSFASLCPDWVIQGEAAIRHAEEPVFCFTSFEDFERHIESLFVLNDDCPIPRSVSVAFYFRCGGDSKEEVEEQGLENEEGKGQWKEVIRSFLMHSDWTCAPLKKKEERNILPRLFLLNHRVRENVHCLGDEVSLWENQEEEGSDGLGRVYVRNYNKAYEKIMNILFPAKGEVGKGEVGDMNETKKGEGDRLSCVSVSEGQARRNYSSPIIRGEKWIRSELSKEIMQEGEKKRLEDEISDCASICAFSPKGDEIVSFPLLDASEYSQQIDHLLEEVSEKKEAREGLRDEKQREDDNFEEKRIFPMQGEGIVTKFEEFVLDPRYEVEYCDSGINNQRVRREYDLNSKKVIPLVQQTLWNLLLEFLYQGKEAALLNADVLTLGIESELSRLQLLRETQGGLSSLAHASYAEVEMSCIIQRNGKYSPHCLYEAIKAHTHHSSLNIRIRHITSDVLLALLVYNTNERLMSVEEWERRAVLVTKLVLSLFDDINIFMKSTDNNLISANNVFVYYHAVVDAYIRLTQFITDNIKTRFRYVQYFNNHDAIATAEYNNKDISNNEETYKQGEKAEGTRGGELISCSLYSNVKIGEILLPKMIDYLRDILMLPINHFLTPYSHCICPSVLLKFLDILPNSLFSSISYPQASRSYNSHLSLLSDIPTLFQSFIQRILIFLQSLHPTIHNVGDSFQVEADLNGHLTNGIIQFFVNSIELACAVLAKYLPYSYLVVIIKRPLIQMARALFSVNNILYSEFIITIYMQYCICILFDYSLPSLSSPSHLSPPCKSGNLDHSAANSLPCRPSHPSPTSPFSHPCLPSSMIEESATPVPISITLAKDMKNEAERAERNSRSRKDLLFSSGEEGLLSINAIGRSFRDFISDEPRLGKSGFNSLHSSSMNTHIPTIENAIRAHYNLIQEFLQACAKRRVKPSRKLKKLQLLIQQKGNGALELYTKVLHDIDSVQRNKESYAFCQLDIDSSSMTPYYKRFLYANLNLETEFLYVNSKNTLLEAINDFKLLSKTGISQYVAMDCEWNPKDKTRTISLLQLSTIKKTYIIDLLYLLGSLLPQEVQCVSSLDRQINHASWTEENKGLYWSPDNSLPTPKEFYNTSPITKENQENKLSKGFNMAREESVKLKLTSATLQKDSCTGLPEEIEKREGEDRERSVSPTTLPDSSFTHSGFLSSSMTPLTSSESPVTPSPVACTSIDEVLALLNEFFTIFHEENFFFVGWSIVSDLSSLCSSYHSYLQTLQSPFLFKYIDLQFIIKGLNIHATSLSNLSRIMFGKALDKSCQCSEWNLRPLCPEQIAYASHDSYVLLLLYLALCVTGKEEGEKGYINGVIGKLLLSLSKHERNSIIALTIAMRLLKGEKLEDIYDVYNMERRQLYQDCLQLFFHSLLLNSYACLHQELQRMVTIIPQYALSNLSNMISFDDSSSLSDKHILEEGSEEDSMECDRVVQLAKELFESFTQQVDPLLYSNEYYMSITEALLDEERGQFMKDESDVLRNMQKMGVEDALHRFYEHVETETGVIYQWKDVVSRGETGDTQETMTENAERVERYKEIVRSDSWLLKSILWKTTKGKVILTILPWKTNVNILKLNALLDLDDMICHISECDLVLVCGYSRGHIGPCLDNVYQKLFLDSSILPINYEENSASDSDGLIEEELLNEERKRRGDHMKNQWCMVGGGNANLNVLLSVHELITIYGAQLVSLR